MQNFILDSFDERTNKTREHVSIKGPTEIEEQDYKLKINKMQDNSYSIIPFITKSMHKSLYPP